MTIAKGCQSDTFFVPANVMECYVDPALALRMLAFISIYTHARLLTIVDSSPGKIVLNPTAHPYLQVYKQTSAASANVKFC